MGRFISLVSVENEKLWKRMSTKIMILILVGLIFLFCGVYKAETSIEKKQNNTSQSEKVGGDWKKQLKAEDISLQSQIDELEKSNVQSKKQPLDSYKMELAQNKYRIEHNLKPGKSTDYWSVVTSSGLGGLIALFAIIACAGLVAGEFSDNTMKTMISRPFARWQILSAKFAAVFIYGILLQIAALISIMIAAAAFFGINNADAPQLLWFGGSVHSMPGFAASLITNGLDFLDVLVYLIFAFALSVISRSRALATGLAIFLMFAGTYTRLLAYNFSWGKLIFFADTGFSSFVTDGAPFYGITLSLALLICAVYCAAFLFAGYFTFAKRDIN